jgi:putative membrane protein
LSVAAALVIGVVSVAAFLSVRGLVYGPGAWAYWWFPFGWFAIIPALLLLFFAIRMFFWSALGWGWGGGWYRGARFDPALEVLRERFASGEVTKDQYEQMRRDLCERE